MRARLLLVASLILTLITLTHPAWAWSNGGYSTDPSSPAYGTHDWIAERALDWLPVNEKALILTYRAAYLYGTELPDNPHALGGDGIGDSACCHHFYFYSSGAVQDDVGARRATAMGMLVSQALGSLDYAGAAKWSGAMTHYIDDLGVFGHVMGAGTDWGAEVHHSDYEEHILALTNSPSAASVSLTFDGTLATISPYDAAKALAHDTTFDDSNAGHTAVWMDQHYSWNDPMFNGRACQSINLAVNLVADAVHTLWSIAATTTTTQQQITTIRTLITSSSTTTTRTTQQATTPVASSTYLIANHVVINEFEQNPPGDERYTGGEFVELFNPTGSSVDISGWILTTTHGNICSYIIPSGTTLDRGPSWWVVTFPSQCIDNGDPDSLVLSDKSGREVDRTPAKTDTYNDGRDWQRIPDAGASWEFRTATKGYQNAANPVPEFPSPLLSMLAIALTLVVLKAKSRSREVSIGESRPFHCKKIDTAENPTKTARQARRLDKS